MLRILPLGVCRNLRHKVQHVLGLGSTTLLSPLGDVFELEAVAQDVEHPVPEGRLEVWHPFLPAPAGSVILVFQDLVLDL